MRSEFEEMKCLSALSSNQPVNVACHPGAASFFCSSKSGIFYRYVQQNEIWKKWATKSLISKFNIEEIYKVKENLKAIKN